MADAPGLARSCVTRPTFVAVRERLSHALGAAQSQRHEHPGWDDVSGMPEWAGFEIDSMLDAVNRERTALGHGPVSRDLVARAEQSASGHVDYSSKFMLGCLDLVFSSEATQ